MFVAILVTALVSDDIISFFLYFETFPSSLLYMISKISYIWVMYNDKVEICLFLHKDGGRRL